ncbi:MAG: S8 family serine peptidase [Candidatus Sungbacteria bacterium]|nr:S8 family serine peptidase [Candidatus Sungbacteria bacterium]
MRKPFFLATIFFSVFVFVLIAATNAAPANGGPDKVRFVAHTPSEAQKGIDRGCQMVKKGKALTVLHCDPAVGGALGLQLDIKVYAQDTAVNSQIGANTVQSGGNTGVGRKIAVVDTGYNYNHPELFSSYLGGYDFVNNDNDPFDDNGHGSHVAGIITADGVVDASSKGVAPDVGVVALKVLDSSGSGFFSDVAEAIYFAVNGADGVFGTADDPGVDAINMSLGTSQPYTYKGFCDSVLPDLTAAVQYAVNNGVAVVSAAGNSGNAGVSIPGCISYSTTVGAVDDFDKIASFSGRGKAVDITAPGVTVYSTWLGSSYLSASGTSMATPAVAAVVALVKFAHPIYTQAQVESALFSTAKDLGKAGKDNNYGWGRVRANLAVQ